MYSPVAGNACDAYFDESNSVTIQDFITFKQCVGKPLPYRVNGNGDPLGPANDPTCEESDFDSSGSVTIGDFATFRKLLGMSGKGLPCTGPGGACPL
jgi:hypothetical protein